jgi:Cysteine rich repeat
MFIACTLILQAVFAAAANRPCRADIEKFCADVSRGGGRVAECLRKHQDELSPECKAHGQELHERVQEAHEACREDIAKYCKEIQPGRGRILACLKEHDSGLSADCRTAMKPAR